MVTFVSVAVLFGNPALLWGGCLVALPLLLQLFLRRKHRDEPWGAMRFLQRAVDRQRQRLQWERWLQLLVRMTLIAVVVLALARPYSERPEFAESARQSGIQYIVVLDSSLSMRANLGTETAFEQGRSKLLQLLQLAPPGSTVQLLRNTTHLDRVLIARPMLDFEAVRLELELLTPTLDRGDWPTTLDNVAALLEQNIGTRSSIVLVTDLQANEWGTSNAERIAVRSQLRNLRQQADLTLINVGSAVENRAVTRLEVRPGWLATQATATALVRVANFGQQPADVPLDLIIDDHPQRRETVRLEPGEERELELPFGVTSPGEHVIEARIGEDALIEDNHRLAILPVSTAIRILLVENRDAQSRRQTSDYLRLALGTGGGHSETNLSDESQYTLHVCPPAEFATLNLARFDTVILNDVPDLPGEQQTLLRRFVQQGGGILLIAGSQWSLSTRDHWNVTSHGLVAASAADVDPFLLQSVAKQHPLISAFQDHPEAGLETTRLYRYIRMSAPRDEWDVVLRYSSLDPAVLARTEGLGRTLLVTTALNDAWGSWVLWPSFVPFIRESIDFLVDGRFQRPSVAFGEPWQHPIGIHDLDLTEQEVPLLTLPDQRTSFPERLLDSDEWTFSGTTQPGAYTMTQQGTSRKFVVHLDSAEFDTRRATLTQLERSVFQGIALNSDWEQLAKAVPNETRADWTLPLLTLGFGLWVCEYLLQRAFRVALALLIGLMCAIALFALLTPSLPQAIAICVLISALQLFLPRVTASLNTITRSA